MRITKSNNVYQLSFMPNLFPINCYLVEEEKDITLIDAGVSFCTKGILKTAADLRKPIRKIVLTHVHSDHIGALDQLKKELPDVEVIIPERELKMLNGDMSLEDGEGNLPIKGGFSKGIKTRPDTLLKDGDQIGSLLAIHSPGHTPGIMAFLDTRSKVLIAGDTFQTKGGIAVSGDMRWSFPFPALATWDKKVAIKSAEYLLECNPSTLAVGHGNLILDPGESIKRAIEHAKKMLKEY